MLILQHKQVKDVTKRITEVITRSPTPKLQCNQPESGSLFDKYKYTNLPLLKPLSTPRPYLKILIVPNITQQVPDYLLKQNIQWSMIVAIKSDYRHHSQRNAIRKSWAGVTFVNGVRMHVIFVLALTESSEDDMSLKKESNEFRDILQVEMNETYQGVGYKAMAAMQWVGDNFPDDWLYFSADDDILPDFDSLFSNMKTLFDAAKKVADYERSLPILCAYRGQMVPWVKRSGKWAVKESEYPHKTYPPMCEGGFYGLTVKLTKAIYNASRYYPYFRHDDIFLTGFMRLAVCDSMREEFCFDYADSYCAISKISPWDFRHIKVKPQAYAELWNELEKRMIVHGATVFRKPP